MESNNRSTRDLIQEIEEILDVCHGKNISKIRVGQLTIEFNNDKKHPEMKQLTDDELRTYLDRFRPTADKENADFERTLYWSAK